VRPWIQLVYPGDEIELVSIKKYGRPGAARAFALTMQRTFNLPDVLLQKIWEMAID